MIHDLPFRDVDALQRELERDAHIPMCVRC